DLPLPDGAPAHGERWLTVRAVTARPEPWAPAGHVLATGQLFLGHAPSPPLGAPVPLLRTGSDLHLGPGVFDARTGALLALAALPCPLPLVGIRLRLPRELSTVEWFGRGPGEAYPDTGYATTVGRFLSTVDGMQTPYVFPQENGRRADVRWAVLSGPGGGLRLSADRPLGLTVRRWTSEQLDRARHTAELSDEGYVYVGVDAGQQGIGTASCGPGPLPRYRL